MTTKLLLLSLLCVSAVGLLCQTTQQPTALVPTPPTLGGACIVGQISQHAPSSSASFVCTGAAVGSAGTWAQLLLCGASSCTAPTGVTITASTVSTGTSPPSVTAGTGGLIALGSGTLPTCGTAGCIYSLAANVINTNGSLVVSNASSATTPFQVGPNATTGTFIVYDGSNPFFGVYQGSGSLYGISTGCPGPTIGGVAASVVCGYYAGMAVSGSSAGSGFNIFGVTNASGTAELQVVDNGKILTPNLPTSAGSGGLYLCVDSTGEMYKKSSCP